MSGPVLEAARRAFERGEYASAAQLARSVLTDTPDHPEALALLANSALRAADLDQAVLALERLHGVRPDQAVARALANALCTRGSRARSRGREAQAVAQARSDFDRALQLQPALTTALFNRAVLALDEAQPELAERLLTALLAIDGEDREAQFYLAQSRLGRDPQGAAAALLRIAAQSAALPTIPLERQLQAYASAGAAIGVQSILGSTDSIDPETALDAANQLALGGDADGARACFVQFGKRARVIGSAAAVRARFGAALALPTVYSGGADLAQRRQEFAVQLDRLDQDLDRRELSRYPKSLEVLRWSNFLLAYQGGNDRPLQQTWGRIVQRCVTHLVPELAAPPKVPSRARPCIAFLGSIFRNCTAGAYFAAWVAALTRAGFETIVFQLGPQFDAQTDRIAASATRLVRLPQLELDRCAQILRETAPDALILPEIGMDARTAALAACRFARVQIVGYGHPVTTGLESIDAFVSADALEPVDAADHYTERLWRLPDLATAYALPDPVSALDRSALGLPRGKLYVVPQAAFKIHPDTDAVLVEILRRDADAVIVLFDNELRSATQRLRTRLEQAFSAAGVDITRRLRILPLSSRARFLQILAACDVMLDTPHWSGGNTTLDAFRAGLPVVSCAGEFLRGRQTAGMYRLMGIDGAACVAAPGALPEAALQLAHDSSKRSALVAQIAAQLPSLVRGEQALHALVERVRDAL